MWVGCFDKVFVHCVSSCIASALVYSRGYLIITGAAPFKGIFEWLFLTFISHYIYIIIHFCLFFEYMFGVVTTDHIQTVPEVFGFAFVMAAGLSRLI